MRRVITGEQVAQIYNPDPFARPVFRAPVYRTPAGLILLAWLARLLFRLARLAFRHPVATADAGAAGVPVVHDRLDRPGRHGRLGRPGPGDLAVLLAVRVRPVGGHPRGTPGGPGPTGAGGPR